MQRSILNSKSFLFRSLTTTSTLSNSNKMMSISTRSLTLTGLITLSIVYFFFPIYFPSFPSAFPTPPTTSSSPSSSSTQATSFFDLKADLPSGKPFEFKQLEGKVTLIFNSASRCGYTSQLTGLEALYKKYKDQGLEVLSFPCNQFGGQEPGSDDVVKNFCTMNHGVTFPIMKKSEVNGSGANEVYKFLKGKGSNIGWNFEKFLVNKKGEVVHRYDSGKSPASIGADIEKLLA